MTDNEKEQFYNEISHALYTELSKHADIYLKKHYDLPNIDCADLHYAVLNALLNLLGSALIKIGDGKQGRAMLAMSMMSSLNTYLDNYERSLGMN